MKRLLTKRSSLVFLAVLFFFIAWNREVNLLYGMFALLTSTLVISHILPRYSLKGITASRTVPSAAFEGDCIDVVMSIKNKGRSSRYMIELLDFIPAAGPGLQNPMTFIGKLSGRGKKNYSFRLDCYKRGEYAIGPLKARSAYPLGISSHENLLDGDKQTLLVYPAMFNIKRLPFDGRGAKMGGTDALSKTGGSEDFFGTRDYRTGDSLRYIHWPSSARHSRFIVKEFEIRTSTDISVIIDLHKESDKGEGKQTTLEYAVKIAASIARLVLDRGYNFQLLGYGKNPCIIPYSKGLHQLARTLETLARINADGDVPYVHALRHAYNHLNEGSAAILLFSGLNRGVDEYLYEISLLKEKRIRPVCVFMNDYSFTADKEPFRPEIDLLVQGVLEIGAAIYFVSKGDNLEEVFGI
ncbi:MAG: DUF58 domain-containing protein [Nitrospirae bacterium]|nr:DUF58 domain-containing protein [Nitrospirota bacterium]